MRNYYNFFVQGSQTCFGWRWLINSVYMVGNPFELPTHLNFGQTTK
jgi:hypothetical protein